MTDAQQALAQVREALSAGPTPGPWVTMPANAGVHCVARINAWEAVPPSDCELSHDSIDASFIAACSPANIAAILAHLDELAAENERLRKFAGRVLGETRQFMSDVDGGDVQAWAVECGLLEEWTPTEPCGEQCDCAEVADFPTQCYRLTEMGRAAIDALKEQR